MLQVLIHLLIFNFNESRYCEFLLYQPVFNFHCWSSIESVLGGGGQGCRNSALTISSDFRFDELSSVKTSLIVAKC